MEHPSPTPDSSPYTLTLPRWIWAGYRLVRFGESELIGGPICTLHTWVRAEATAPRLLLVWMALHPARKLLSVAFAMVSEQERQADGSVRKVPRLLDPDEVCVVFDD